MTKPITPHDLLAMFCQFLGIPLDLAYTNPSGRPTPMLAHGKPIAELI